MERFIRWLAADGYFIVMIRAGSEDAERPESWGIEITVRDPLGLYRDAATAAQPLPTRKPNKWRRTLAYWLFNPDPTVAWAKAAAQHRTVQYYAKDAKLILSSSPPESAHVGAWLLSRQTGVPHIVDMRDGWLDEPLKPILNSSALRHFLESKIESKILYSARSILVTSAIWHKLLCERHPELFKNVHVLTNGYPEIVRPSEFNTPPNDEMILIHAGRFTESRHTQLPDLLLTPLYENLSCHPEKGVIQLVGKLTDREIEIIESFRNKFQAIGWRFEYLGIMPRSDLLHIMPRANGFLLLSASRAAIPSKLFEYIAAGRPIFAVTEMGSATWDICKDLPQARCVEIRKSIPSCKNPFYKLKTVLQPETFSEEYLGAQFRKILQGN